jgi:hypothetical protein
VGAHLVDGKFQSDKYTWCQPGFVPLKITDPMAWEPLWRYAQARRSVDAEFSDDLELSLRRAGFSPPEVACDHCETVHAHPACAVVTAESADRDKHGCKGQNDCV